MNSANRAEQATKYQTVTIELSDGRVGVFTGPVLARDCDEKRVCIKGIKFSHAKDLPKGARLVPIGECAEHVYG